MKCEIIKDLIPLSAEGLCSEESEKEIAEHIKTCENCRLLYEKSPETASEALPIPDEKETFKKVSRTFRKLTLKSGIMAVLLIAVLAVLGWLTYGQIAKYDGGVSFETIVQSFEVRKIAKYIANGDFDSYVDSISNENYNNLSSENISILKEQNKNNLAEAYLSAYGDTEVKSISVKSSYSLAVVSSPDYKAVIRNNIKIKFKDGRVFETDLLKNSDGKYICFECHISNSFLIENDKMTSAELEFHNALSHANHCDILSSSLFEYEIKSRNTMKVYTGMFHEQYIDDVTAGKNDFSRMGFDITNAYCSDYRFDAFENKLYYDLTMLAEDGKGTAVMTTRIYYDYIGLYPPEKDDMTVYTDGCTPELVDALYNFFG